MGVPERPLLAHRVNSLPRSSNRVALGAKRTSPSTRHATEFMSTRPNTGPGARTPAHDQAFPGSAAAFAASYSLVSTNRVGTFALRSSSHASAIMIRMPPTLTNSCAKTPWEY